MAGVFPFGAPVLDCAAGAPEAEHRVVILGAYPSALHVRWTPPSGSGCAPIAAIAVDNEPTPFWDGADAEERIRTWKQEHFNSEWGRVDVPAGLNGPSGAWVRDRLLEPLGIDGAFITDCLTTYRTSVDQARRLEDTYNQFALGHGLPQAQIEPHPDENAIVKEAVEEHSQRIRAQLLAARPEYLITLGNAAARTVAKVADNKNPSVMDIHHYARIRKPEFANHTTKWIPLAHPAAPQQWQQAHTSWLKGRAGRAL